MSEFDEFEARLREAPPPGPRPELREEILARVQRELHPVRWRRWAVAAALLFGAFVSVRAQEAAHRQRVAQLLAARATPRVERALAEVSPYLSSDRLAGRFRMMARREIDRRWEAHVVAVRSGGRTNG